MTEEAQAKKRVAVFIDYENVHICLKETSKMINLERFNIFREIGEKYGKVVSVKPYAVWETMYTQQKAFENVGVKTVPILNNIKNATDITLVVDCLCSAFDADMDIVVLFAGDGGYSPLVNALIDDLDKEVYLYSVVNGTKHRVYERLGDKHLYIDEELKDVIIVGEELRLEAELETIIKLLHRDLGKYPFVGRGHFFRYITTQSELKEYDPSVTGKNIDKLIAFKLINQKDIVVEEKNIRIIEINYDHFIIKSLNLK